MSFTRHLRQSADQVWQACLNHPFVTGIGDGSLPVEKFQFFMLQDYLYLFEYARVFALGVVKAGDIDLMRAFAENVHATLNGEMSLHRSYMARLGISEDQVLAVTPALANTSYTSYMLSVAQSGGCEEIVAAILACAWSYQEIGEKLNAIPGAAAHPFYGEWISSYASAEYARMNDGLIRLMDELADGLKPDRLERLTQIFVTCSRYELGFWDMAWEMRL